LRRAGYERWLRNLAVAIGNAHACLGADRDGLLAALRLRRDDESAIVREHVDWALAQFGVPA
jgi:epoxyqueuosine reductase